MSFHYTNPPAGVYLCKRASIKRYLGDLIPCEEAFRVLVEYRPERVDEEWAVAIPDLATLEALIEKYGECIISRKGIPSITIYDDYVE